MRRDYSLYIQDILECIEKIDEFVGDMAYDEFIEDEKTVDAVLRNLEVIGEAAKNVPEELKDRFPDVEWRRMVGLRNIITHEYFGVDMNIIWQAATRNVPETEPLVADMLERLSHDAHC